MNELTPMQDLLQDLKETKINAIDALNDINDIHIRAGCQEVVAKTLDCIIERIETELLPKEKQTIKDAHEDGADWQGTIEAEDYYNLNFRKDE